MFDISRETGRRDADIGRQLRTVQLSVHLRIRILKAAAAAAADRQFMSFYAVSHKNRATLFCTTISVLLDEFLQLLRATAYML